MSEWTEDRIAEAERICAAASDSIRYEAMSDYLDSNGDPADEGDVIRGDSENAQDVAQMISRVDAEFWIHARTAYPSALAEIRRLREENGRLAKENDNLRSNLALCQATEPDTSPRTETST